MIDIKKITERRGELVCAKIDGMATEEELEELAQLNELLLAEVMKHPAIDIAEA